MGGHAQGGLHNAAAVAQRKIGDLAGARRDHEIEFTIKQGLSRRDTTNRDWQRYVAVAHHYLADIKVWTGDADGAVSEINAAHAIYVRLAAGDSTNVQRKINLVTNDRATAQVLLERGDIAGALNATDAARAVIAALPPSKSPNPIVQKESTAIGIARARALLALGRSTEARTEVEKAIALGESELAKKPADIDRRRLVADGYVALGDVLAKLGGAGGTTAWARALVLVDSMARSAKETEYLALQASAMMRLGGGADAKPVVDELLTLAAISSLGSKPGLSETYISTTRPRMSSTTGTAAASATSGTVSAADSISLVPSRCPATLITSSTRPRIRK